MKDLDTPTVSDALDRLGLHGQCLAITPLDPSMRVCGPAFTVLMLPAASEPGTVGDYIDEVADGRVVVIDARGRTDATVWGDLLTATAVRQGVAGTVIDGACRDTRRACRLGYPIFARGHTMRTGKSRLELGAVQVSVAIAGVRVEPGDLVVGDADGVCVVPAAHAQEVERVAREIAAAEDRIRVAIAAGEPLARARSRTGYHDLQGGR